MSSLGCEPEAKRQKQNDGGLAFAFEALRIFEHVWVVDGPDDGDREAIMSAKMAAEAETISNDDTVPYLNEESNEAEVG